MPGGAESKDAARILDDATLEIIAPTQVRHGRGASSRDAEAPALLPGPGATNAESAGAQAAAGALDGRAAGGDAGRARLDEARPGRGRRRRQARREGEQANEC